MCFCACRTGYHLGITNTALYWLCQDVHLDFVRDGAVIVSAVLVGAVIGSLFAGQAADALGPRKALLLNNGWLLVGSVLCAASPGGYFGLLAGMQILILLLPLLIDACMRCAAQRNGIAQMAGLVLSLCLINRQPA